MRVVSSASSGRQTPPRSTLIPYTTLFRSGLKADHKLSLAMNGEMALQVAARTPPDLVLCVPRPDRKSTRLNSSHSQISYAVFCLKKKTCPLQRLGRRVGHGEEGG